MQIVDQVALGGNAMPFSADAATGFLARATPVDGDQGLCSATGNVLAFSKPSIPVDPLHLIEAVTIRCPSDILDASNVMERVVTEHRMRIMVLPNISSRLRMVDADGNDLNSEVFGWQADAETSHHSEWAHNKCPIIRACRVEGDPFWVNRSGFRTAVKNPLLEPIELRHVDLWSTHKAAIVVPIHLPIGEIAVAKLVSIDPAKDDLSYEFARFYKLFADLTRRFVSSYVTTMRDNPYLPHDAVLSPREVDCLRWAAFGKTDKEVGVILGSSHATVRYHLARACTKLDATNRVQAVFRAAQLGYLGSQT